MRPLEERARAALAGRRALLLRRFGWAGLDLRCAADPRRRTLALAGEVVTARTLEAALAELAALLPAGWAIDARGIQVAAPLGWFAPAPGVTRLWRSRDMAERPWRIGHGATDSGLCTEMLPADGPVALLATSGQSALVQGRDGTVGWTRARLGPPAPAPGGARATCSQRHALNALSYALRRFRGAPYTLGGTTFARVDCSGLVQRCLRMAIGVVMPRHSTDQLALAAAPVRSLGEPGDLLFMWGEGESPCHVGVVLRGDRPGRRTVIHASSRRGRVVEEPLACVLARTAAVRHVELDQVLALRR